MLKPSAPFCQWPALAGILLLTAQGANFTQPWPAQVKAPAPAIEPSMAEGILYDTPHFRIFSDVKLSPSTQEELSRLLEGCYAAVSALPLNPASDRIAGDAPGHYYPIILYRSKEEYLKELGPAYAGSTGACHRGAVLMPLSSLGLRAEGKEAVAVESHKLDSETLTHELVHLLTLRGATWDTPSWFGEGIAEYVRLAADDKGNFNFAGVSEAIAACVIEGRKLGRELRLPPLEQVMNMQRAEFQQARGREGQLNYAFATLLTWYFIHLDGEGGGANLKRWYEHLQGKPKATAHLRYELPENATPEQIKAEQQRLWQQVLNIREIYHYEPLLNGRSWQELEEEFRRKVAQQLGITLLFTHCPE